MNIAGFDGSFDKLTPEAAKQFKDAGYETYSQCLWTGREAPSVAQGNLYNALNAGLIPQAYASLSPRRSGAEHMADAYIHLSDEYMWGQLAYVWVDVETLEGGVLPGTNEDVDAAIEMLWALKAKPALYTNFDTWTRMGNHDIYVPLVDANWDGDFTPTQKRPYGGNPVVLGKQWKGGHSEYGFDNDSDMFNGKAVLI